MQKTNRRDFFSRASSEALANHPASTKLKGASSSLGGNVNLRPRRGERAVAVGGHPTIGYTQPLSVG